MKAYATYFDTKQDGVWERMARVLRYTCAAHDVDVTISPMPVPVTGRGIKIESNHEKLRLWNHAVQNASAPLILLDVDMFCQHSPEPCMRAVQHVGITYRDPNTTPPINGGVVYVQPTEQARAFFTAWVKADGVLHANPKLHAAYRERYAGMNQASLGMIMEGTDGLAHLVTPLSCRLTNCVEPWTDWERATFVHIKGRAFEHIFHGGAARNPHVPLIKRHWLKLEKECLQSPPTTLN